MREPEAIVQRLRRRAGAFAVDNLFRGASALGRLHPRARPERHKVVIERDIAYRDTGLAFHRLDVYRPEGARGPMPTVFYVHGGGFRILSKDTHWVMGLSFARRGYLVVNISYRLAPAHRFPAAVEDCAAALGWLLDHADEVGIDRERLAFAGESAGANLVTTLALMCSYERDEPFARALFDRGFTPRAVLPYCGMLQVSDAGRFYRRKPKLGRFIDDRLREVSEAYLGDRSDHLGPTLELADPLTVLERGAAPTRPLPPFFATVGTADPLLDDTRRLSAALGQLGVPCETVYYPGQVHAFHALVWREPARRCWRDSFRFLDRHLRSPLPVAGTGEPTAPPQTAPRGTSS